MRNYYVYALIDPRNNLPFYIGKGQILDKKGRKYRRIKDHLRLDGKNVFKNRVIKKIVEEFGEVPYEILKEGLTEEESFDLEKKLIVKYGRRNKGLGVLTNLTDGGDGPSGQIISQETRRKISEKNKEFYKHNQNHFLGKNHSEEVRKVMSEKQQERFKREIGTFTGMKHSEETKQKISLARENRRTTLPPEEWHRYASCGGSKVYKFISPSGEVFEIKGEFKKFVRENKLAMTTCQKAINEGRIPPPKNLKHNRVSQNRINSTGWEIIRIER